MTTPGGVDANLPGVLVVDDSAAVRRLISAVIQAEPGLRLAGTAADGAAAVAAVERLAPDAVVLDVEMPVLDGLAALRAIKASRPRLPVVMYSTLTGPSTSATIEALALGAEDFATKPQLAGRPSDALRAVRADLIPKLLALTAARPGGAQRTSRPVGAARTGSASTGSASTGSAHTGSTHTPGPTEAMASPPLPSPWPYEIVAVATSTGGPAALTAVLGALRPDLPAAVVIAQHMPATFTNLFATHLDRATALPVEEVTEPGYLEPGRVYVATGGRHLVVRRRGERPWASHSDAPPEQSCRPAADVLLRSLADSYGPRCLAVVLTGMGRDGLAGSQQLVARGGTVIVQDEATSVVWGMPGAVAKAGLADTVLPLDAIAPWINAVVAPAPAPQGRRRSSLADLRSVATVPVPGGLPCR